MVGSCRRHARQCTARPGQPFSAQEKTARRCRFSPGDTQMFRLGPAELVTTRCCCLTMPHRGRGSSRCTAVATSRRRHRSYTWRSRWLRRLRARSSNSSLPAETRGSTLVAAPPRDGQPGTLASRHGSGASKHCGDSRNRGKGGQPAWPITTPDGRGRREARLWRGGGRGRSRSADLSTSQRRQSFGPPPPARAGS
jgi:hypothetical protein